MIQTREKMSGRSVQQDEGWESDRQTESESERETMTEEGQSKGGERGKVWR